MFCWSLAINVVPEGTTNNKYTNLLLKSEFTLGLTRIGILAVCRMLCFGPPVDTYPSPLDNSVNAHRFSEKKAKLRTFGKRKNFENQLGKSICGQATGVVCWVRRRPRLYLQKIATVKSLLLQLWFLLTPASAGGDAGAPSSVNPCRVLYCLYAYKRIYRSRLGIRVLG